jgi:hypothetical protein
MPTCMYWVLERRAADGDWEAVLSNVTLRRHPAGFATMVGATIGAPDPEFFTVMSGRPSTRRDQIDSDIEPYATPGLPKDASAYALGLLCEPMSTGGSLKKARMTDPGHIYLDDLSRIAARGHANIGPGESLSGNAPAEDYLARLNTRLNIILGRDKSAIKHINLANLEILTGQVVESFSGQLSHVGMDTMSQHTRLNLKRRLGELTPCTDGNLRLLFAYGF